MRWNVSRRASVSKIGRERLPLVCIDDFAPEPDALVASAEEAMYIDAGPIYPGVRAPAPRAYADTLLEALGPLIEDVLGAAPRHELELCAFSMVVTPPDALKPLQRIPHFDGAENTRFAFVHYLCSERFGGTSFYRHRSTGFERVTQDRVGVYLTRVRQELAGQTPAQGYVDGDTASFERIHCVPARYNRLILYWGSALHSGDIPDPSLLLESPRAGRLTINGFGHLR